jgi:hypothetical protein
LQKGWKGAASELLAELDEIADQIKINTNYRLWPKSPNSLSRRITEVKTNLREIGITIDRSARDPKTNSKTIEIRKISLISLESLADKNHAQITNDIPNDIDDNLNDISLENNKISLGKIPQNHAQNSQPNDINNTNDILHTSQGNSINDIKQPSIIANSIYRLSHSDIWACHNCRLTSDKWFMQVHDCKGAKK